MVGVYSGFPAGFGLSRRPKAMPASASRIGLVRLEVGQLRLLELIELLGVEGRAARHLGHEREHGGYARRHGLDGERHAGGAAGHTDARLEAVQAVLQLLARERRGAAAEHIGGHLGGGHLAGERLLGTEAEDEAAEHLAAARLLREAHAHPVRERRELGARIDVRGRCVERFAGDEGAVAVVVAHERGDIHRPRDLGAVGLTRSDRTVRPSRSTA